ncbi:ABC transporter substrate-binding protein [Salibacterium aidingense]|uniref:ABC transporter substrate-binding protein n=1 Tax=Salibacterium aidingense TaxID=384933 RepID=UPI0004188EC5|nr:ABC transporter substrate-binding protein [Salibacterium aidingense]
MQRTFRLWWKTAVILSAFTVIAACSSGEEENGDSNTSDETEDSSDNEGSEGEGAEGLSGDFEIQYFVGGYGDEWWKEVIGDFQEEHPDLNIIEHAGPNINEEMRTRWVSDDPPDVVYIDGAGSSETQMVEDNQLMNLTDWAEDIELEDGSALMDSFIVEPNTYDGELYSLPLVFDTWGTWYDKAWFEENDWEVPTDFDHFMEVMGTIQEEEGIEPFVTTGQYPYYFLRGVLNPAFGSAGGDELLADLVAGEEGAWTSDETLNVMKKVEEMASAGLIDSGYAALNHTQSQMNFLLHENAFIPVGFWLPNEMENDTPEDFQYGFTPSPFQDEGEPYVVVPDLRPLAIAENAENPEAAKAFVEFVFNREYAQLFSEYTGAIMNISDVDLTENPNVPEYLQTANEMINDPDQVEIHSLPYPMSADLEEPISDALVALMSGDITAEEFTERAEEAAADYRE